MRSKLYYCYLVATLSIVSCTSNKTQDICDKKSAFQSYEAFSNRLNSIKKMPTSQIAATLVEWKVLEDTLLHFIITDSIQDSSRNVEDITRCAVTKNNITDRIIKLIDSQPRSYEDIIVIQQSLNDYSQIITNTTFFHEAENFFKTLKNNAIENTSSNQVLNQYVKALRHWNCKEISSLKDLQEFVAEENTYFINFLNHLYEYDSKDVRTIIKETSEITERMYRSTANKKLKLKELSIYMSIRTNRRLIQNAAQCVNSIKSGTVETPAQAAMTVSMLLNPYSNYNDMCIGLRTKEQLKELNLIGRQIEPLIKQLKQERLIDELPTDSLPYKLIKEQILIKME